MGNDNKGHGHEFFNTYGGMVGKAAVKWAQWTLKGDTSAAEFFKNKNTAQAAGWSGVKLQNLDNLNFTALA